MNNVRVNVLTVKSSKKIGAINADFFPLIKWKKAFLKDRIIINFFLNHLNRKVFECDVLILDYRYFEQIRKGNVQIKGINKGTDESFIIEFVKKTTKSGIKVVLFDSGDGAGTRCGPVIPFVDLVLKKQVFSDLSWYLGLNQKHQVQVWLPDNVEPLPTDWKGILEENDLKKLKVGWNIGIRDIRIFPDFFRKYSPIHQQWLFKRFINNNFLTKPGGTRKLFLAHRGAGPKGKHERYDYSRRILSNKLKSLNRDDVIIGGRVNKKTYLQELKNAKITISPFGHGEVCHRDFEAVISGSLLVKPSMDHLVTWPNIYIPYETYVPVKWDYSDLEEKLLDIENNYENCKYIVKNAQEIMREAVLDYDQFIKRFKVLLNIC